MTADEIKSKIIESISDAQVIASDMTGGGDHWMVKVTSKEFEGKSMVNQHRMIYAALGDWMEEAIHALDLETRTPS